MELSKVINKRITTKEYVKTKIDEKDLHDILEASRWAPTALGAEQSRAIVITNDEIKNEISEMFSGNNKPKVTNSSAIVFFTAQNREVLMENDQAVLKKNMYFLDLESERGANFYNMIVQSYQGDEKGTSNLGNIAAVSKMSYFTLKATDMGYGTTIMTGFSFKHIEEYMIKKGWIHKEEKLVVSVAIGTAKTDSEQNEKVRQGRNRKKFEDYVLEIK